MARRVEDINVDSLIFSKPKSKSQSENKFLYVYSEKTPLTFKLPKMRLPFGATKDTLSKKNQFIVDLSFEKNSALLESFEKMDEAVIKKVHLEFFPEKNMEDVRSMYTSCVKRPNNPAYHPTLRSKIVTSDDGKIKCIFYESEQDDNGKYPKIDIVKNGGESYISSVMNRGSYVESIVECIGLWMMNDKFGLSYKINQVKIFPKVETPCDFIDSDDDTSNSDVDFLGE
jgi:hypothetical protein